MTSLRLAGHELAVTSYADFLAADTRRGSSFITNFGNWRLPAEVASALGGVPFGHIEWIHETGELVLIGSVPVVGWSESDVSRGTALEDEAAMLPTLGGMPVRNAGPDGHGGVRLMMEAEVVPASTHAVLLDRVEHGPAVHELLWGWHRHHGDDDGWSWLAERLAGHTQPAG